MSAAQSAFDNRLISTLSKNAPSVDPAKVILIGATDIRTAFPKPIVDGILLSYLDGLRLVFIIAIVLGGLSFVAAMFAPGGKINIKKSFGLASDEQNKE